MKTITISNEEHRRTAIKTVSWRIIASATGMLLVYYYTGMIEVVLSFGVLDMVLKTLSYYLHERVWNRIQYGKNLKVATESAVRVPPVTVQVLEPVSTVIHKIVASDIGAVVVVDENNSPTGLITKKDILERVVEAKKEPSETIAKDIMTSPLVTVERGESPSNMLSIMRKEGIRRLVATDRGKTLGIISERRVLEVLAERRENLNI